MLALLLLSQIAREEFLDFRKQAEVQFARIDERFNKIESEIQVLNQRINDLDKKLNSQIDSTNKRIDDFISFMWILASVLIAMATLNLGLVIYLIIKMDKVKDKVVKEVVYYLH